MADIDRREGGCLCGSVRYSLPWPPALLLTCSCTNCQRHSGGAVSVVAVTARDALDLSGELKTYNDTGASGEDVYRNFCPNCGSAVITDTPGARANEIIFVKAGTLDETSDLDPTTHCWASTKQKWLQFGEGDVVMQKQEALG